MGTRCRWSVRIVIRDRPGTDPVSLLCVAHTCGIRDSRRLLAMPVRTSPHDAAVRLGCATMKW